jgi:hypothetical protein
MSEATLITFPPSLDSELSRFLVDHYRIEHREQRHTLIFSSFATLRHGATILFPLLYTERYRLSTVRQIVDRFEPMCPPELKLLPGGLDGKQVEADWSTFNDTLAFSTAIFAYYHLLPHREIMIRPLSEGAPDFEVSAVTRAYPVFAGLLRLLLFLTSGRAEEALVRARAVLQGVDDRLADGRRYLVGGALSLSDVAFAVAAAPLVLPQAYGGPLPSLEQMPEAIRAVIAETRDRPSGRFALRIYRDHRAGGARTTTSHAARGSETNGESHGMVGPA